MGNRTDRRSQNMSARRTIAIICGTVTGFDAISECALACLNAAIGPGISDKTDVRVYCLDTNVSNSCIHVVASVQELVADPFYQCADLIIHHFGIMSELHLALALAPRSAYLIVQYYGITPPQFMTRQQQHVIGESFFQIGLFESADEIVVNSSYLADEVRRSGVSRPIRQLDLFGVNIGVDISPPLLRDGNLPLKIVYCGRFVQSKQILPLIQSLDEASPRLPKIHLTLIGVTDHSDAGYLSEIRKAIATASFGATIELNLTAKGVAAAIAGADLLVLPSLHEGFGMPVAEALAAGTPVVCSDAGSLPEVASGLALLFAAGDTAAMASALERALLARAAGEVLSEVGTTAYPTWREKAQVFAAKYSRNAFVGRWRALISDIFDDHWAVDLVPSVRIDALQAGLPSKALHDTAEAQLFGRFTALKAAGRWNVDRDGAIDVLHRWAFGCAADLDARDYWQNRVSYGSPMSRLINELSQAREVRSSSLRLRSIGALKAVLQELDEGNTLSVDDATVLSNRFSREQVELVLSHAVNDIDFLKEAYLLILQREAEPGGLRHYLALLQEKCSRTEIINQLFSSPEYSRLISGGAD